MSNQLTPSEGDSKGRSEDVEDQSNSSFVFSLSEKGKFQLIKGESAVARDKDKKYIAFRNTFRIDDQSNKRNIIILYS